MEISPNTQFNPYHSPPIDHLTVRPANFELAGNQWNPPFLQSKGFDKLYAPMAQSRFSGIGMEAKLRGVGQLGLGGSGLQGFTSFNQSEQDYPDPSGFWNKSP